MRKNHVWSFVVAVMLGTAAIAGYAAQGDFPVRSIRIICPYPPGGLTDILSRLIAQKLSEAWGQQVVVDNRTGGAAVIASELLAKSPPDGYTIGMLLSTHTVNPSVIKNLPYDTERDFTPVSLVAIVPGILTVLPSFPAQNVKDIIALAKARPGQLTYASPGLYTSGHLSMEYLKVLTGVDIRHIPYKGGSPAVLDILGGRVDMMISSGGSIGPHIKSGRLIAIATTSSKRVKSLPNVPTIAESGIANYETYEWYGILAPAKTPPEIISKLQHEIAQIVRSAAVAARIEELGAEPIGNTSDQFSVFIKAEMNKWGKLAKEIGLKPE
jgi:tripartite-type tricarboxylate transporter receptor subunit TctC